MDSGPLENYAGEVIIGYKEMAEELNMFFATVFTVLKVKRVRGQKIMDMLLQRIRCLRS